MHALKLAGESLLGIAAIVAVLAIIFVVVINKDEEDGNNPFE